MKALIFLFILAFSYCYSVTFNWDTPSILIGNWKVNNTVTNSSSPCCVPGGNTRIINHHNKTIILTSEKWIGHGCAGRTSSYKQIFLVNGSDSYNELFPDTIPLTYLPDLTTGKDITTALFLDDENGKFEARLRFYENDETDPYCAVELTRPLK